MTHSESTSARPEGVKLPSTSTNGLSFELLLFLLRVLALEQTWRAQSYEHTHMGGGRYWSYTAVAYRRLHPTFSVQELQGCRNEALPR